MGEAVKRIIEWTKLKLRLHVSDQKVVWSKEREIWWAHLGANLGDEEDGKNQLFERPVLIVGGESFTQYALLAQLRAVSPKRLVRKLRVLPKSEFQIVVERIKALLPK